MSKQYFKLGYTWELLDVCSSGHTVGFSDLIARRQTVSVYLKKLVRIGLPAEKLVGREKLLINPELLQLLTREPTDLRSGRTLHPVTKNHRCDRLV